MSALPAQLLIVLVLLVLGCYAPGLLLVRRLRWFPARGLETLCASVALSLVLLWLAVWTLYLAVPPSAFVAASWSLAAAIVACAVAGARDTTSLLRSPRVRHSLVAFAALFGWTLLVLLTIRNYSGAIWVGDWLEHFQRSLFFLHHFPISTPIYKNYVLPARPPMMNVLAAFFMAVTTDRYEIFQLVFAFLNLLPFLACCLALPLLTRGRRFSLGPLTALFALNPAFMENATYAWTKLLTAFFVIFALTLYLRACRKRDSVRMTLAFVCLAAGLLVHYSAGPYVVFLAAHYLVFVWRHRPAPTKELAWVAVASAALLLTWFGWSITAYGLTSTLSSNTAVTSTKKIQGSNLEKVVLNTLDSVVPRILYQPEAAQTFAQPYHPGFVRDIVFLFYNTNLIFSMGLIGGPAVTFLVIATLRRKPDTRHRTAAFERTFWILLIAFSVAIGLAVVGERDLFGVAHLTLIPLELLGLTLLAGRFFTSRTLACLLVAGCAIDFGAGIFLQERMQHLENSPGHTYFTGLAFGRGQFLIGDPGPDSVGPAAWNNWMVKRQIRYARQWLAAGLAFRPGDPALAQARTDLRIAIDEVLKEDDTYFRGWYRQHGGEIQMLGDIVPADATLYALPLAALALLFAMAKAVPGAALAVARSAVSPQRRRDRQGA